MHEFWYSTADLLSVKLDLWSCEVDGHLHCKLQKQSLGLCSYGNNGAKEHSAVPKASTATAQRTKESKRDPFTLGIAQRGNINLSAELKTAL